MKHVSDKSKEHFMFSKFFRKWCLLWDDVGKYGTAGQVTDDNIIPRKCVACWINKATHTHTHTHTHIIFNNYCLYMAKLVTWTRHNVTL